MSQRAMNGVIRMTKDEVHGLTLNFLVFGLLHAVFVTVTVFINRRFGGRQRPGKDRRQRCPTYQRRSDARQWLSEA